MPIPENPRIYHIVHVDRLASIVADGHLLCDATIAAREGAGTNIGISQIKRRRLEELELASRPGLRVGQCVPFYFCPRSVMLYLIHMGNHPNLTYPGGQGPVVHLEADLRATVAWAETNGRRWAFTLSNAGSYMFEDRSDLAQLDEIDWEAVQATNWSKRKEGKQAEFLLEQSFPFELVERIGVLNLAVSRQVAQSLAPGGHRPVVEIRRDWYY